MTKDVAALALLEFYSAAHGILAVDRLLKRAPIALLRCGTVHPGHYLALLGGTVASVEEGYREGGAAGELADAVFLPDPHPGVRDAALGDRATIGEDDTVGVVETVNATALLRAVDAALKAAPVGLGTFRLADDLGGRGLALVHGDLPDVQAALAAAESRVGDAAQMRARTLLPRPDAHLREVLNGGTEFRACKFGVPHGAEKLEA
ncbi:BMC domain-containing protein [bacterium]|nr:BMC domain-containing protein [bacterium]